MDGLIVCQALRADPATAAIPIIMLTARGEEADRIVGPRARRRRLRHQAVQPEGARRARPRAAAPRSGRDRRAGVAPLRPDHDRRRPAHRDARRRRGAADREGIPAAAVPGAAPRPRAVARPAAHRRLGLPTTPAARAPSTSTSGGCARSCRCSPTRIETIKQFGYKLVEPAVTLPHPPVPDVARHRRGDAGRRRRSLVSWSRPRAASTSASSASLVSQARLAAETLSHRQAGHAGGARRRSGCARPARRRRASRSSRRTAPSSATRELDGEALRGARESRRRGRRFSRRARERPRHRAALQHDARRRHALRRGPGHATRRAGARRTSGSRCR